MALKAIFAIVFPKVNGAYSFLPTHNSGSAEIFLAVMLAVGRHRLNKCYKVNIFKCGAYSYCSSPYGSIMDGSGCGLPSFNAVES